MLVYVQFILSRIRIQYNLVKLKQLGRNIIIFKNEKNVVKGVELWEKKIKFYNYVINMDRLVLKIKIVRMKEKSSMGR